MFSGSIDFLSRCTEMASRTFDYATQKLRHDPLSTLSQTALTALCIIPNEYIPGFVPAVFTVTSILRDVLPAVKLTAQEPSIKKIAACSVIVVLATFPLAMGAKKPKVCLPGSELENKLTEFEKCIKDYSLFTCKTLVTADGMDFIADIKHSSFDGLDINTKVTADKINVVINSEKLSREITFFDDSTVRAKSTIYIPQMHKPELAKSRRAFVEFGILNNSLTSKGCYNSYTVPVQDLSKDPFCFISGEANQPDRTTLTCLNIADPFTGGLLHQYLPNTGFLKNISGTQAIHLKDVCSLQILPEKIAQKICNVANQLLSINLEEWT